MENLVAKILEYFIQLAHLDEEQLAQYYAMNKQNEDYMGDEGSFFQERYILINKIKFRGGFSKY